tara:strand:- start:544 stop:1245 length:702 start_codon:yes stop_codon:yes gene_type:complete
MRKLLILMCISLLGISLVYGFGEIISTPETNNGLYDYQYKMDLREGWNLVALSEGFPSDIESGTDLYNEYMDFMEIPGIERKGERKSESPFFSYVYIPEKGYVEIFPEYNVEENEIRNTNYAMWIYVKEATEIEQFAPNVPKLEDINLFAGWNLVALNPQMSEKSLDELKGTCDLLDAYVWESKVPKWEKIPFDFSMWERENLIGGGIAIKVSENCNLGSVSGTGIPEFPNIQ